MGSSSKLRPTPRPTGPALVRPVVGVLPAAGLLVVALGGAAGCKTKTPQTVPPMIPDDVAPMAAPMEEPAPVDEAPADGEEPADDQAPMPAPE